MITALTRTDGSNGIDWSNRTDGILPQSITDTLLPVAGESREALDARWSGVIRESYDVVNSSFHRGVTQAISFGALLTWVKLEGKTTGNIKHGEFGPWLEKHCPEVTIRTVQRWMDLAEKVVEKLQIRHVSLFPHGGYLDLYRSIACDHLALSAAVRDIKRLVDELVDGKNQSQLLLALDVRGSKGERKPDRKLTSKEAHELQLANDDLLGGQWCDQTRFLITHPDILGTLTMSRLQDMEDARIELGKSLALYLKSSRKNATRH